MFGDRQKEECGFEPERNRFRWISELNPVETIWLFMHDNWLSTRIFEPYDEIVVLGCEAWNKLIDQPWKIMSIGRRKSAYSSN